MKKKYTKKQITEAINYWSRILENIEIEESSTSSGREYESLCCKALKVNVRNELGPGAYVNIYDPNEVQVYDKSMISKLHNPQRFHQDLVAILKSIVESEQLDPIMYNKYGLIIRTGNKTYVSDICVAYFDKNYNVVKTYWIECKKDVSFANIWTPTFKMIRNENGVIDINLNNQRLKTRAPKAYDYLNNYFKHLFAKHANMSNYYFKGKNQLGEIILDKNFGKFLDYYFIKNEGDYQQYNLDYMQIGTGIMQNGSLGGALIQLNKKATLIKSSNGKKIATSFEEVFNNGIKISFRIRQRDGYVEIDADIMVNMFPNVYSLTDVLDSYFQTKY